MKFLNRTLYYGSAARCWYSSAGASWPAISPPISSSCKITHKLTSITSYMSLTSCAAWWPTNPNPLILHIGFFSWFYFSLVFLCVCFTLYFILAMYMLCIFLCVNVKHQLLCFHWSFELLGSLPPYMEYILLIRITDQIKFEDRFFLYCKVDGYGKTRFELCWSIILRVNFNWDLTVILRLRWKMILQFKKGLYLFMHLMVEVTIIIL